MSQNSWKQASKQYRTFLSETQGRNKNTKMNRVLKIPISAAQAYALDRMAGEAESTWNRACSVRIFRGVKVWRGGRMRGSERAGCAAIRAGPVEAVAGHAPEVLGHALLADLESAGTVPAESVVLCAAAASVFLPPPRRFFLRFAGAHFQKVSGRSSIFCRLRTL